jgi:hypothetical protein
MTSTIITMGPLGPPTTSLATLHKGMSTTSMVCLKSTFLVTWIMKHNPYLYMLSLTIIVGVFLTKEKKILLLKVEKSYLF